MLWCCSNNRYKPAPMQKPQDESYSPMQQNQDGYEKDEKYSGFADDTYAFMTVRLFQYWDVDDRALLHIASPPLRLFHAFLIYILSAAFQISLTYVLYIRTDDARSEWEVFERNSNQSLHDAAETLLHAASAGQNITEPMQSMCSTQIRGQEYIAFYYFMVFVWFSRMTAELQSCVRNMRNIFSVRTASSLEVVHTDKGEILIKAYALWQKMILLCTAVLIRLIVGLGVMYCGGKFIILQTHTVTIIIKALAMLLVIGIDELFFNAFVTLPNKEDMKRMKIAIPVRKGSHRELWDDGLGGIFYVTFNLLSCFAFTCLLYGDFMSFRMACHAYNKAMPFLTYTNAALF